MHTLIYFIFGISLSLTSLLIAKDKTSSSNSYERSSYVDEALWNELSPYFFPADRPEKATLDKLFSKRRLTSSLKAMDKAGFYPVIKRESSDMVQIVRHPLLNDYLIKFYPDSNPIQEWEKWKKRIRGSQLVQRIINEHGLEAMFKTPKKWIYPLPESPDPKNGQTRHHFILIVEDMHTLLSKNNLKAFKKKMTKERLDGLFTILLEAGLSDSIYADNIPFCYDGKIALLDTEHNKARFPLSKLANIATYLSAEMALYWEQLIAQ